MKIKFLILLPVFFVSLQVQAQDDIDFQTWIDYTQFFNISKKTAIGADLGSRGIISDEDWRQLYIRPTYRHLFGKNVHLAAGFAYFYTDNDNSSDLQEWRLFEEVSLDWPQLSWVKFNHRIRFEQRFFDYKDGTPEGSDDFATRPRYQLALTPNEYKLFNIKFISQISFELFLNEKPNSEAYINNSRLTFMFGKRFSRSDKIEINYIIQSSRALEEDGLQTSEHILRLRYISVPRFLNRAQH